MQQRKSHNETDDSIAAIFIPIEDIQRNPLNPRGAVKAEDVSELAASIKKHGVMQPILVDFDCKIIAGERRFVAAKSAGLTQIPVVFRDVQNDREVSELALIENIQRQDLKPITEARAYADLMKRGLSVDEITEHTGIRRDKVYRMLRLLKLPTSVQESVESQTLAIDAALALLQIEDTDTRKVIATKAIRENLTTAAIRQEAGLKPHKRESSKCSLQDRRTLIINHALDRIESAKAMIEPLTGFGKSASNLTDIERRLRVIGKDLEQEQNAMIDLLMKENKESRRRQTVKESRGA